jgi:hypothetical protein
MKAKQNNIDKQRSDSNKGHFEGTVHAIEPDKENREHLITFKLNNP